MTTPDNTIGKSGDEVLKKRVADHLGEEFLHWTKEMAAPMDLGDLDNSDPRIRASNKVVGDELARGGSGPKKTKA